MIGLGLKTTFSLDNVSASVDAVLTTTLDASDPIFVKAVRLRANVPPGRLLLLLAHRLGPLAEGRAAAQGVDDAVAMAAQPVALARDVGRVLDDELIVRPQPHILGPLQEALHGAPRLLLRREPVVEPLPRQPAAHH